MLSRVRDHAQVYGTAKRRDRDVSVPPRPQRVLDASFSCWRGELPDSFHQRQHHPTTPTEQPPSFVFSIKTLLSFVAITFSVLQSIRFCLFNHWSFIILSP